MSAHGTASGFTVRGLAGGAGRADLSLVAPQPAVSKSATVIVAGRRARSISRRFTIVVASPARAGLRTSTCGARIATEPRPERIPHRATLRPRLWHGLRRRGHRGGDDHRQALGAPRRRPP